LPDQEEKQFREALQRKAEEARRRTFEEESRAIALEVEERAQSLTKTRLSQDAQSYSKKLQEAQDERRREESKVHAREEDVLRKLRKEAEKKAEARKRAEKEAKRRAEEEQRRREEEEKVRLEEERRRAEQEARRRAEEEQRRLEEEKREREEEERRRVEEEARRREDEERERAEKEARRRAEEERRRVEEEERTRKLEEARRAEEKLRRANEDRRKEGDRKRREEDALDLAREREERIQTLIGHAEVLYDEGDYVHASVEVAKALVNDEKNARALDLERKIKETQRKRADEVIENKPRKQRAAREDRAPIAGKKKPIAPALMIAAVIAILVVSIVVIIELKKSPTAASVSIAVMPWTSSAVIQEEDILGSALAEETAARLRELNPLMVMDYASSYRLAHFSADPNLAAFRLGFRYVLQGKLSRSETGYFINLRLVDSLRNLIWSHRFDKASEALPTAPDEISHELAAAVGAGTSGNPPGSREEYRTSNADAYGAYLEGLEMLHHRSAEATANALRLFETAFHTDPKFAEAFAAAACVLARSVDRGWDVSDTALPAAEDLARRAIALDPSVADAYRALGEVLFLQGENRGALREIDSSLTYAPKSPAALLIRAKILLRLGKPQDAIGALSHAYEENPRDPELLHTYAVIHQLAGKLHQGSPYHLIALNFADDSTAYLVGPFADAVILDPELSVSQSERVLAACERVLRARPDDYVTMYRFARLLQVTGKPLDARELLAKTVTLLRSELDRRPKNARAMMYLALILTRQGKFPEATALAIKASSLGETDPEVKYKAAQMYSLQMYSSKEKKVDEDKKGEAVKALREAVALRFQLDELANADFYNMFERPEFRSAIQENL